MRSPPHKATPFPPDLLQGPKVGHGGPASRMNGGIDCPLPRAVKQVVHVNGGTLSGRSCNWLLAALKPGGALASVQRVIAYVNFQVGARAAGRVHAGGGPASARRSTLCRTPRKHVGRVRIEMWLFLSALEGGGAMRALLCRHCAPPALLPASAPAVPKQATADEVAQKLSRGGVRAVAYHAGKDMNERQRVQVRHPWHSTASVRSCSRASAPFLLRSLRAARCLGCSSARVCSFARRPHARARAGGVQRRRRARGGGHRGVWHGGGSAGPGRRGAPADAPQPRGLRAAGAGPVGHQVFASAALLRLLHVGRAALCCVRRALRALWGSMGTTCSKQLTLAPCTGVGLALPVPGIP